MAGKSPLDCFEYHPKWTEIAPKLLSGDPNLVNEAIRELEDNNRYLENFLRDRVCNSSGVASYCQMYAFNDFESGADPVEFTVTMPRNVGNKVLLNWTYTLYFVNGTPYVNHNVETHPLVDGNDLFYNSWVESDANNDSIMYSRVVSGHYLVEIPDGAGDFVVGVKVWNYGYADCQLSDAFITGLDVGTGGGAANCLIVGS